MFGKTQEKEPSPKGVLRKLSSELTLTNSVKRMFAAPVEGAEVVKGTAEAVIRSYAHANDVVRNETFEDACDRHGVSEQNLALIHNQLVVQFYITFFAGLAALTIFMNAIILGSGLMLSLASLAGSVACFVNSVQASLQAFRIRSRDLCDLDLWLSRPGEWLPSRLPFDSGIRSGDSRLDRKMWVNTVIRARKYFVISIIVLVCSVLGFLNNEGAILKVEFGPLFFGIFFCLLGVKHSLHSLQCAEKKELDLAFWLQRPNIWWPPMPKSRRNSESQDKAKADKVSEA